MNAQLPVPVPYVRPHPHGKSLPSAGINPHEHLYPDARITDGGYEHAYGEASHHQSHTRFAHKSQVTQQGSVYASRDHRVQSGGGHVPEGRSLPPMPRLPYGPGFYIPQGLVAFKHGVPSLGTLNQINTKHTGKILLS